MELGELSGYVITGDAKAAEEWTQKALAEGMDPLVIMNQGLVPGMDVVGQKFKSYEYYLPEVLISARAMKASMALVRPLLVGRSGSLQGRVVIGTVKGDLHDIGKNLVGMMLEGAGFEVHDLGADVAPEVFVQAIQDHKAQALCLSALLTTTMPMMKSTIEELNRAEIRHMVKVMVGGAPVTEEYAQKIGADGFASDAASAAEKARQLVQAHAS